MCTKEKKSDGFGEEKFLVGEVRDLNLGFDYGWTFYLTCFLTPANPTIS